VREANLVELNPERANGRCGSAVWAGAASKNRGDGNPEESMKLQCNGIANRNSQSKFNRDA